MAFNPLGIRLTLLVGPTIAVPAPPPLLLALQRVEVEHSDNRRSGFELTFSIGRSGPADVADYALVANPLLKAWNRVVVVVTFGAVPYVLSDGVITMHQVQPGAGNAPGTLTVTGEDVSVMMDRKDESAEHPAQPDNLIVTKLLAKYATYAIAPMALPPTFLDPPIPIERTPTQQGTDLDYLQRLAERHGNVFYVMPGPAPNTNVGYWGPPIRGPPQRALNVNLGPQTNVDQVRFSNDATAPRLYSGQVQDRRSNQVMPVQTPTATRLPLSMRPSIVENAANVRQQQLRESGLTSVLAMGRAQGRVDASTDRVVQADGTLDALRYGSVLMPRALVGLRGAGMSYDGDWYVSRVRHVVTVGTSYKQEFVLAREGLGAKLPVVVP